MTLARRALAEATGTGFLVTAVVGSGIMGDRLSAGSVGFALLANTLATTATLFALIAVLASISGAHFNPIVTALARIRAEVGTAETLAYLGAQLVGALAGVVVAHLMFGLAAVQVSSHVRAGWSQVLGEAVATFGLILVVGRGRGRQPHIVAGCVAAYLVGAYWFTSSTSFANPVVTLARATTDTFAGIRPSDVPGFLLGQVVGGALGIGLLQVLQTEKAA